MEEPLISPRDETLFSKYFSHNFESISKKRFFLVKLLSLICLAILIGFTNYYNANTSKDPICMEDTLFVLSESVNSFLSDNDTIKNALIILSSFLIDINIFIFLWNFLLWGNSWRELTLFGLFYSFRGFLQGLTVLGFSDGFIWGYPGIYSFFITYVKSSDFFYSGHVGLVLFLGLYYHKNRLDWLMWYSLICCTAIAFVMVLVRCHYGIDIVAGLLYCHYFWIHSEWIAVYVDNLGFKFIQDDFNKSKDIEMKLV